jgi:aspartyl-tRNA(Asn)/glutamyl-tRNA(Gln) amidotransferase subunit C
MISKDDVQKLADLAHVAVPDAELEKIAGEMDSILTYVSDVSKLASEEGEREKDEIYNVMRDDVVTNTERQYSDDIIAQFPDQERGYLRVKKIL